jgi:hypothetical protein
MSMTGIPVELSNSNGYVEYYLFRFMIVCKKNQEKILNFACRSVFRDIRDTFAWIRILRSVPLTNRSGRLRILLFVSDLQDATNFLSIFLSSGYRKMRGAGSLATDRIVYRTVVIDICLFFLWARRLFCNVFPFPVGKAQLIGDWYENRRGAPNTIIFLIFRQYYWRTDTPCANSIGGPNPKQNPRNIIGLLCTLGQNCLLAEGDIGAPI